jgi:hypothetical protein
MTSATATPTPLSPADRAAHEAASHVRRPTAPLPAAARDALERALAEADRLQLVEVAS